MLNFEMARSCLRNMHRLQKLIMLHHCLLLEKLKLRNSGSLITQNIWNFGKKCILASRF